MVGDAAGGLGEAFHRNIVAQFFDLRKADITAAAPVDLPVDLGGDERVAAHDFGFKESVFTLAYRCRETFYIIEIRVIKQGDRYLVRDHLAELVADHTAVSIILL